MSFSKYTKRRGQFEVLEAKQLFAADLMGGAAADLSDTAVVAGLDYGGPINGGSGHRDFSLQEDCDYDACFTGGTSKADSRQQLKEMNEKLNDDSLKVKDFTVEQNLVQNLSGQEGEDIARQPTSNLTKGAPWAEHNIGTTIGRQEGELCDFSVREGGPSEEVIDPDGIHESKLPSWDLTAPVLGGQEGEPVTGIIIDGLADSPSLGGQEGLVAGAKNVNAHTAANPSGELTEWGGTWLAD